MNKTPYLLNYLIKNHPGYLAGCKNEWNKFLELDQDLKKGKTIVIHDLELKMMNGRIKTISYNN